MYGYTCMHPFCIDQIDRIIVQFYFKIRQSFSFQCYQNTSTACVQLSCLTGDEKRKNLPDETRISRKTFEIYGYKFLSKRTTQRRFSLLWAKQHSCQQVYFITRVNDFDHIVVPFYLLKITIFSKTFTLVIQLLR